MKTCALLMLLPFISGAVCAESAAVEDTESAASSPIERMQAIGEVDSSKWGIRRGCISLNRIRSINFSNDQSAIIDIGRGREAILRLKRECKGIRSEGFAYKTRGSHLCEKFDSLRLLISKRDCQIESIEPYLKLEEISSDGDER